MYKQSASRPHRSKGVKVKYILQICLLLAVCFWLIYQVERSREKRKEFDAKNGKVVGNVPSDSHIQKFGRKDPPRTTALAKDEEEIEEEHAESKHEEDELEKEDNKHEEDGSEKEDNEHEEDEPEKEDSKQGEDEVNESETERIDVEPEHEEESVDEDNERASEEEHHIHTETEEETEDLEKEKDDAKKEDHSTNNTRSDDQEHEARDAQYKADDASSEVAQNVQTLTKTGNFSTGQGSEMFGKVNFAEGNENRTSDKDDSLFQSGILQPREGVMNSSVSSPNATATYDDNRTNKLEENPSQNSTFPIVQHSGSASVFNGTQAELSSGLSQNTTGEGAVREMEEQTSKPEISIKTENAAKEDSSLLHAGEKSNNNVTTGTDESLLSGGILRDPIGQSNTTALYTKEERNSGMNLGSLQSNTDAVAE